MDPNIHSSGLNFFPMDDIFLLEFDENDLIDVAEAHLRTVDVDDNSFCIQSEDQSGNNRKRDMSEPSAMSACSYEDPDNCSIPQ